MMNVSDYVMDGTYNYTSSMQCIGLTKCTVSHNYTRYTLSEMPVFRKFPDFRKFFSDACVQKYRQKCIFRKFANMSVFFDNSDWHLCTVSLPPSSDISTQMHLVYKRVDTIFVFVGAISHAAQDLVLRLAYYTTARGKRNKEYNDTVLFVFLGIFDGVRILTWFSLFFS